MSTTPTNSARRAPVLLISQEMPTKIPLINSPYLTGSIPDLLEARRPKSVQEHYMKEIRAMTKERRENANILAHGSLGSPDGFTTAPSAAMSLQKRHAVIGEYEGEEVGKEEESEDEDEIPELLEPEPEFETEDKDENRDGHMSVDSDGDDEEGYVVINDNEEVPTWEQKTEEGQDSLIEDLRPLMRRFSRGMDTVYRNGVMVSKHGFDLLPEHIRTRILDSGILESLHNLPRLNLSDRRDRIIK